MTESSYAYHSSLLLEEIRNQRWGAALRGLITGLEEVDNRFDRSLLWQLCSAGTDQPFWQSALKLLREQETRTRFSHESLETETDVTAAELFRSYEQLVKVLNNPRARFLEEQPRHHAVGQVQLLQFLLVEAFDSLRSLKGVHNSQYYRKLAGESLGKAFGLPKKHAVSALDRGMKSVQKLIAGKLILPTSETWILLAGQDGMAVRFCLAWETPMIMPEGFTPQFLPDPVLLPSMHLQPDFLESLQLAWLLTSAKFQAEFPVPGHVVWWLENARGIREITGNSGGVSAALNMQALFTSLKLPMNKAVSATLNPDGSAGPVIGEAYKLQCASNAGIYQVLFEEMQGQTVLAERSNQLLPKISGFSTLEEAWNLMRQDDNEERLRFPPMFETHLPNVHQFLN